MEQKKEHTFVANEEASTRGEKISLNRSIAIIGAGDVGTYKLRGILNAKLAPHDKIIVSGTHSAKLEKLGSKWKINHTLDNMHATQFADIVMLCVKPVPRLEKFSMKYCQHIREDQMLISIAAGVTIDSILQRTGKNNPIVRAMPNIASTVDEEATAVSFGRFVTEEQQRIAISIFEAVGEVVVVEESQLNAVTGLSGSGEARVYLHGH